MKAVVYKGPFKVAVEEVEDPRIEHPNDVIVRITSTAICGSDLHMYEGRTAAEPGIVFGHENMGIVEECRRRRHLDPAGRPRRHALQRRLRLLQELRRRASPAFCLTVNPGFAGGAYGYVAMGPYRGGQAEYLRVPFADFNCLKLPPGNEHETDFVLLADIFPTGYHGCELARVSPGESVAVYGGGPVGLMAAYSALLRGASKVFVVDRVPERLQKAEEIGAIPINFEDGDPVEQIKAQTDGEGSRQGRRRGRLPGAGARERARGAGGRPQLARPDRPRHRGARRPRPLRPRGSGRAGRARQAGHAARRRRQAVREGPAHGNRPDQRQALHRQPARPRSSRVARGPASSSRTSCRWTQAPEAYEKFDKRVEGYTKVILHP